MLFCFFQNILHAQDRRLTHIAFHTQLHLTHSCTSHIAPHMRCNQCVRCNGVMCSCDCVRCVYTAALHTSIPLHTQLHSHSAPHLLVPNATGLLLCGAPSSPHPPSLPRALGPLKWWGGSTTSSTASAYASSPRLYCARRDESSSTSSPPAPSVSSLKACT